MTKDREITASDTTMRRYDLHMHSRRSYDSFSSPAAIVAAARRRGLSGIAVTDHGTMAGSLDVLALAPENLLVIAGAEIHTSVGDIVGLFLKDAITGHDAMSVIDQIHAQGGIAFLPHPLKSHPPLIPADVLAAVDAYEALNGRAGWFDPAAPSPPGRTTWTPLLGKARLGNSDGHFVQEIGGAWTGIRGPATADNLLAAIREGRTEAGGASGPPSNFYKSQMVKLVKTGDVGMVYRLARRMVRKLF